MNKQLSEECIKAITEALPMKDGVPYYLDQWKGAKEALTNPEIYTKADLISKDDAFSFAEWIDFEGMYDYSPPTKLWYGSNSRYTTEELFTLYQQTK